MASYFQREVPIFLTVTRSQDRSELPFPYLLFLGNVSSARIAKTAFGIRDWAPEKVIGEFACSARAISLGLPKLRPVEAQALGAKALVIGVANNSGFVDPAWIPSLIEALEAGLDIISGMHNRLADDPRLEAAAHRFGCRLIDIRTPPSMLSCGNGRKRAGRRLLTVGTDCASGKKYTAMSLANAFIERGVDAEFRATGQTGIIIAGSGIPMDAIVADYSSGAAEVLSPDASPDHWDVIEGQGSLFHPSYAGVSLSLLHGSQPDVIVVCHELGRNEMLEWPTFRIPSIEETIEINLRHGRLTNGSIRCAGVSINTAHLDKIEAEIVIANESARLSLPVADPLRGGRSFANLVDACLKD